MARTPVQHVSDLVDQQQPYEPLFDKAMNKAFARLIHDRLVRSLRDSLDFRSSLVGLLAGAIAYAVLLYATRPLRGLKP